MADRPDVGIVTQAGLETTHGTNVTCAKRFLDLSIYFDPELLTQFYRAFGYRWATAGVKHREWSVGRLETDVVGYNSIVYALAMLFGHGTVTTASGASTWPFAAGAAAGDAYKSLTVQNGDAEAAYEVAFATLLNLSMQFSEGGISMSGDMIGRAMDTAVTPDTVTDTVDQVPISFTDLTFYIDNTFAGLGTTIWTHVFEANVSIPNLRQPTFVLNASVQSFSDLVDIAAENGTLQIVAAYNAQTRAFVDAQKADTLPARYIQIKAIGEIITGAVTYSVTLSFAVKLESCKPRRNVQGVYAWELNYRIMHTETFPGAIGGTVINTIATL